MARRAGAVIGLLLGGGFYLLLIDTTQSPELYAGAGAAILAAIAFEVSREQGFVEAAPPLRALKNTWRVLARIPTDVWLVSRAAIEQLVTPSKGPRGRFRAVAFDAPHDDPHDAGRRALAEALGSLTPNTIVVGVDSDSGLILVHQLDVRGGREQLDPLELG